MEKDGLEKMTKEMMGDSKLHLTDPLFDGLVMNQILREREKQINRQNLLLNIKIFAGIELFIFILLLMLLLFSPGIEYISSAVRNSMLVFQKIGKLAIDYDYLILSFIVVGVLDQLMNRGARVSVKN